jgi:plastocyanin
MKAWLVVAAAAVAVLVQVAPAAAGGFCAGYNGERVTDAAGDRVVMRDNCFRPTVVRVERGSSVRFVNRDATAHAVGGTAGSFGDMHASIGPGKLVSYTFERDGIFPYVCMLHPGMAGAVVVGDGVGPSSTKRIAATVSNAAANSGQPPAKGGGAVTSALIPVGLGIGAIWALTVFARRERRSRAGSPSAS